MAFGALLGAGIGLASKFLGGTAAQPEQTATGLGSGWSGAGEGFTPAIGGPPTGPPQNILGTTPIRVESTTTDDDEPQEKELGPLGKVNKFLGTEVGRLASGLASGAWNDRRRRRATEKQFEFLQDKGLSPYEIAGGSSGGIASPTPSTLGTSPSATSGSDRALKARDTTVKEKAQKVSQVLSLQQWRIMEKQAEKIGIEIQVQKLEYNNYWEILGAKMGPENLKMALALHMNGLDLEQILLQLKMTEAQELATIKTWRQIHNEGSEIYRNVAALLGQLDPENWSPRVDPRQKYKRKK